MDGSYYNNLNVFQPGVSNRLISNKLKSTCTGFLPYKMVFLIKYFLSFSSFQYL